ncbi:hypothetical protein RhiirA4_470552 [Rhizophagus irregularis]|uniref:Uncharacterized protein n=1 Tax=Rhizophagus irregularis TaxID=588596 RepID=A0A2I1H1G8_9GLOM|nr:hypothetical protein RhiirA4_470552 [Rhizophagus irregularis]
MKTSGDKTLCYALSRELINAGIPCATLYVSLVQGASIQEKIFEEVACGLIKILFDTPEKLASNKKFCRFITQLYEQKRFVLGVWGRLGVLKQRWKFALIMLLNHIYREAAEKCHIESIYNLGIGYRYGIGTEASKWT